MCMSRLAKAICSSICSLLILLRHVHARLGEVVQRASRSSLTLCQCNAPGLVSSSRQFRSTTGFMITFAPFISVPMFPPHILPLSHLRPSQIPEPRSTSPDRLPTSYQTIPSLLLDQPSSLLPLPVPITKPLTTLPRARIQCPWPKDFKPRIDLADDIAVAFVCCEGGGSRGRFCLVEDGRGAGGGCRGLGCDGSSLLQGRLSGLCCAGEKGRKRAVSLVLRFRVKCCWMGIEMARRGVVQIFEAKGRTAVELMRFLHQDRTCVVVLISN